MINKKVLTFIGGAVASTVVGKVLKTEAVHKTAVNTLSQAMQFKDKAVKGYEKMKEEAQDLAYEAKLKAKQEAKENFEVNVEE